MARGRKETENSQRREGVRRGHLSKWLGKSLQKSRDTFSEDEEMKRDQAGLPIHHDRAAKQSGRDEEEKGGKRNSSRRRAGPYESSGKGSGTVLNRRGGKLEGEHTQWPFDSGGRSSPAKR